MTLVAGMRVAVIGGGIAGLAAARRLEGTVPGAEVVLVERDARVGGKVLTERMDGFLVEAAPDSFLSRKERGVGLCEELGLAGELVGRRPENERTFVRLGDDLHPLPTGLTGMIPTNLDALADSDLLSSAGRDRLAAELELPPAPPVGDESIAAFVVRRFGREVYERLVEPLMTGIYGGDGEQLSLQATFPQLRALEREHGSVLRGLQGQRGAGDARPPFLALRSGMGTLADAIVRGLERTTVLAQHEARAVRRTATGYVVELDGGERLETEQVLLALPAFAAAELLAELDPELAELHAGIPYASSAIVTLAYRAGEVGRQLDAYGYVVPRAEEGDVLACTWSSSKWPERAPEGFALVRVYAGQFGRRDVTAESDAGLVALARTEVAHVGISAHPVFHTIHRWPRGMPQYVLGHPERLERIETALENHPGLALAGAAYRGVGIPDCIASGERAAERLARSPVPGR